jgi:hypothetical protein
MRGVAAWAASALDPVGQSMRRSRRRDSHSGPGAIRRPWTVTYEPARTNHREHRFATFQPE